MTASGLRLLLPGTAVLLGLLLVAGTASTQPAQAETPTPTATPRPPAPTEDRVHFPQNYQRDYQVYYTLDRADNKQVRVIYANENAVKARSGEPYPYASVLVMETYRTKQDERGNVILDANGRFQKDQLAGIFVMRKEQDFGTAYGPNRTGEWEYVAYRPDGTHLTPPSGSFACAVCHRDAGGGRDWVYRANLFHTKDSGALPVKPAAQPAERGSILKYTYLPAKTTVKVGSTFTWTNNDEAPHTVTSLTGAFDSKKLATGASFSQTFDKTGIYEYGCLLHPAMRATVVVEGPATATPSALPRTGDEALPYLLLGALAAALAFVTGSLRLRKT